MSVTSRVLVCVCVCVCVLCYRGYEGTPLVLSGLEDEQVGLEADFHLRIVSILGGREGFISSGTDSEHRFG